MIRACLLVFVSTAVVAMAAPVFAETHAPKSPRRETVILVHGLLNSPAMMKPLEWALEREGYRVVNWGYPSRELGIEEIAARLDRTVRRLDEHDTLHFVGFSLGAISARYYLAHYSVPHIGRFVQIAPPNHGSERADQFHDYAWFKRIWGDKATGQLRTANPEFFDTCGIPPCEFGIIAGGKGDSEGFSRTIPGDDDGTVSVESARLPGYADFVTQPSAHTSLLHSQETRRRVISFLRTGRFVSE